MALDFEQRDEPDYPSVESPTKMSFIIRQGLESLMFAAFTLCLAIIFPIYIVLITFTMLPLTIISSSRKWSNLSNWYLAPKDMQSNIYEYYRKNSKKLSLEWDIEKAKPTPLARLRRGFVSQELITSPQPSSGLITRLPTELRLQIYKEVILGNSTHVHITVHRAYRAGEKRRMSRMRGQFCNFHITKIPVNDCICFDAVSYGPAIPRCGAPYSEHSGRGILALSKTCRQIYMETIVLLYTLPTFYFNSLSKPPFFLQSLLPARLAQIKHIQLCYHQSDMTKTCTPHNRHSPKFQRRHNLQQCNSCNLHLWLDTIRTTMTALESVDVFVYIDKRMRVPLVDDEWVSRVFALQRGPNGLRQLQIELFFDRPHRTLPLPGHGWIVPAPPTPTQIPQLDDLEKTLQEMIRKGAEPQFSGEQVAGDARPKTSSTDEN